MSVQCDADFNNNPLFYEWSNVVWHNICFANRIPWSCPCRQCHWYVTDSLGQITSTRDFKVCTPGCDPNCEWEPFYNKCLENPDDCIKLPEWSWPTEINVECEGDLSYYWSGEYCSKFPLAHMIPWDCPCRQCRWTASNSSRTSTWTFQLCDQNSGCWSGGSWGWSWSGWSWSWNNSVWWEIPINLNDIDTPIIVSECNSCPCNYADFANTLNINDRIKAILRDDSLNTIYNQSIPVFLNEFL